MEKITIDATGKVFKEKWDCHVGEGENRLQTGEYVLFFYTTLNLGERLYSLAHHNIVNRRLVYWAKDGHSMRIYY